MSLARSWLFAPASRPERFDRALTSGADAIILDLEDGVAECDKPAAQEAVASWLAPGRRAYVRVNAPTSRWLPSDLEAVGSISGGGLLGVVVPKCEGAASLTTIAEMLSEPARIVPLIETARGVLRAEEIASQPRVARLALGALDLKADTGITADERGLLYARSHLVLASRSAGAPAPIDSVTTSVRDADLVARGVQAARSLGFGAKLCIHPAQVGPVNRGFMPTDNELAWAHRVVETARASAQGALELDGELIDSPEVKRAGALLSSAAAWSSIAV